MEKPVLIILIGISGSGKSTIAKKIKEEKENFKIFCLDEWNKNNDIEINFLLACKEIDFSLKEGNNIIFDAINLTEWNRQNLIANIHTICDILYIFVDTSLEEAIRRDSLREKKKQVGANWIIRQYVKLQQEKEKLLTSKYKTVIIKN